MADFAVFVSAAERALEWREGEFVNLLSDNSEIRHIASLDGSPIGRAIMKLPGPFEGTASLLLRKIVKVAKSDSSFDVPKAANKIGSEIRRIAPALREFGYEVEFTRTATERRIRINPPVSNDDLESNIDPVLDSQPTMVN